MKNKVYNLLLALVLMLPACAMRAQQVDVTSLYLKNADFEACTPNSSTRYWGDNKTSKYYALVTDWTRNGSQGCGAAVACRIGDTEHKLLDDYAKVPDVDINGEAGGICLAIAASWQGSIYYSQKVTLPAGKYTLCMDILNRGTTSNMTNRTGFFATGFSKPISFPTNSEGWKTVKVEFELTSPLEGNIQVGYTAGNSGIANMPRIFVDNVRLLMEKKEAVTGPVDLVMDMVHHNPGEAQYDSRYNTPQTLADMGFNSKCFYLFDSPTLAIDWDGYNPNVLPVGSADRQWVEAKAARLHQLYAECEESGVDVYAMCDLVLLPKRLVSLEGIGSTFGDATNAKTQELLRYQMEQTFKQFPELDGLVVRIGETYLQDAPYHQGSIQNKTSADKCIVPLMTLLREVVCEQLGKRLVFRSWMSFDEDLSLYTAVSEQVEPHDKLFLGVKHCEGDFHRGNAYSKVLGQGRHKQVVEVQCAREYEGKGAFPNYVARGVIDGFEEHESRHAAGTNWNLRDVYESGLLSGVWTWTRGGGWEGPYIKDELWCDLNAWVMAQWALHPEKTEEELFDEYCKLRLGLDDANANIFRQIALLSEHATLRGLRSAKYPGDVYSMWVRDEYITFPTTPTDATKLNTILAERDEACQDWEQIAALAEQFSSGDAHLDEVVKVTCEYGRQMYRIFRDVTRLAGIAQRGIGGDKSTYISDYDEAWACLETLRAEHPDVCPTLYNREKVMRTSTDVAHKKINEMREYGNYFKDRYGMAQRDITVCYLDEARAFARAEEPVNGKYKRYGQLKNWTVENLGIDMGADGINNGADQYIGVTEISLNQWYNNFVGSDSKIYRKISLPEGRYAFSAYATSCYGMEDGKTYMFASTTLPTTSTIETLPGCTFLNIAKNPHLGWSCIEFSLDEPRDVYLGWCADFTSNVYEYRVSDIQLLRAVSEADGLPAHDDEALHTDAPDLYIPVSQWGNKGTYQGYKTSCQNDTDNQTTCRLADWKDRAAFVGDVDFGNAKYDLAYFVIKYDGSSLYGNSGTGNLTASNSIDLWIDNTTSIYGVSAGAVQLNGKHIATLPGTKVGGTMTQYDVFEVELPEHISGVHSVYYKQNGYAPLLHGVGFRQKAYIANMKIGAVGYGTFCAPFDVTLPEGVEAFTVDGSQDDGEAYSLELTNVGGVVEAHTPVIIKGEAVDVDFEDYPVSRDECAGTYLRGVYTTTLAPVGSYVMQNLGGQLGFYPVADGHQPTLKQSRCYLSLPEGMEAKAAILFGDATALGTLSAGQGIQPGEPVFDLTGRRLPALRRGVNIVGRHKFLVR